MTKTKCSLLWIDVTIKWLVKKRQNLYLRARKSKDLDVKNHYNYAIQLTLTEGIERRLLGIRFKYILVRELQLLSRSFGHLSINLKRLGLQL